eukprot:c20964_g1_i2.p1 GENE.c20964_g1_i2~~c20964_g1_i2.p1  ORF type:complete len:244 (+),score=96.10 c20964_g1_i2:31-762(+)
MKITRYTKLRTFDFEEDDDDFELEDDDLIHKKTIAELKRWKRLTMLLLFGCVILVFGLIFYSVQENKVLKMQTAIISKLEQSVNNLLIMSDFSSSGGSNDSNSNSNSNSWDSWGSSSATTTTTSGWGSSTSSTTTTSGWGEKLQVEIKSSDDWGNDNSWGSVTQQPVRKDWGSSTSTNQSSAKQNSWGGLSSDESDWGSSQQISNTNENSGWGSTQPTITQTQTQSQTQNNSWNRSLTTEEWG